MKKILLIGAGRSSYSLIQYLLNCAMREDWELIVGDMNLVLAQEKVKNHPKGKAIQFDINQAEIADKEIAEAEVVISLLPPFLHSKVAQACLKFHKHLITASYVSPEIKAMNSEAKSKGLLFLNEIGLDPGIDHLSAMQIIDRLKAEEAKISAFRSYTGGLVAPEYDNNPWHYKFTWNPRNVVLAGQGTAKYIINGQYKYVPYHRLFSHLEQVSITGHGEFEGYPNRDSLTYREVYGIAHIPTLLRGTLRSKGFCQSWNVFVQLGMTDDSYVIENSENMTYREFTNSFLQYSKTYLVEEKLAMLLGVTPNHELIKKIEWLGLLGHERIGLPQATPAQILQHLLEKKWKLEADDKDMIVMQHIFEYETLQGEKKKLFSSLVVKGENKQETAMAKTVGLPLGIATKLLLHGKISLRGVLIPVQAEIYVPVLEELAQLGIQFSEEYQ
ncbi:saccharopine dehydrogenase C-terminal domain-containing protein [Thermoflexibacter ruber]|uniref:Saccharopine dehydrogenase (NADP+, L-glutamate forming) n=1 Tax=Thermoflexibacter ruber TaxID=1003 RepID=A0A1I2CT65_9BACT|nr:saccharopine dehydrogenase C-terminal domain-containing protein [Thermoflexibacter ruber]SFE71526.1 saccharopine dehydrogenase (NADP+, L-glutamate forming) [Thermoflexibacter ruber]